MRKVLIVEDDKTLCNSIKEGIAKWGFDGISVENFEDILQEFIKHEPHLVIMDINLPNFDGFYWCRRIRNISKAPVIFLSSRDNNMDIIMAVSMGGDDYITKPFSMDILLAKIQALFRRAYSYTKESGTIIECSGAVLDLNKGTFIYNDKSIELTKNEFKILQLLMKNKGKIVSRNRIMRALWESEYFISENTLTVNVNRLRNKLEEIDLKDFIATKKSQGYIIP